MNTEIQSLFNKKITIVDNIIYNSSDLNETLRINQDQTSQVFSDKWEVVEKSEDINKLYNFQFEWFLKLYGFESELNFKNFLKSKNTIIDTGCGLGYKAAWFAKLAPHALVIGIDISDSILLAAQNFKEFSNLFFIKGDIAATGLINSSIDLTVCDQVIMHTENPDLTFNHLSAITSNEGHFLCYVYSKKALPRELLDDYFRIATHSINKEDMWEFSSQITELGKRLSELNISFECPDIPLLGIKGGIYDIQRFIYWNFIKCFWKEDWGFELSKNTNFDWYAPSNARRFSRDEFLKLISFNNLIIEYFHEEEACFSGRFFVKNEFE
jgi:SAM-dependent methyltransferase